MQLKVVKKDKEMKKIMLILAVAVMLLASATSGWAFTPIASGEPVQVYKAINFVLNNAGVASTLANNTAADPLQVTPDAYWENLSGTKGGDVAIIGVGAGHANELGTFAFGTPGTPITPVVGKITGQGFNFGTGVSGDAYDGSINTLSGKFGFSLTGYSSPGSSTVLSKWFSDQGLNSDGWDHMLSYQLAGLAGQTIYIDSGSGESPYVLTADSYLLAWEDLAQGSSDKDFNDAIYLVTKVHPIPEPMSMMLLGSGLVGLFGLRRKIS